MEMPISFERLVLGKKYGRLGLAALWGYAKYNAIARGVVTPAGDNKIVLFVTAEKLENMTQYKDYFVGDRLYWDGETNHANDKRVINAAGAGDEIHLFYRERPRSDFTYFGTITLIEHTLNRDTPSRFVFATRRTEVIAASAKHP
jgi:putative restriction endonuclease